MEVGDKPASFVGSREWIGSYEVCIVVDQLYGVCNPIILQTTQVLLSLASQTHFRRSGSGLRD